MGVFNWISDHISHSRLLTHKKKEKTETLDDIITYKPHEECAVSGVYVKQKHIDKINAAEKNLKLLINMTNRGDQSCGQISYSKNKKPVIRKKKDLGPPQEVFKLSFPREKEKLMEYLRGEISVGHNRYSTSGKGDDDQEQAINETQPFFHRHERALKRFGIALNGNIENAEEIKQRFEARDYLIDTDVDTELIMYSIANSIKHCEEKKGDIPELEEIFKYAHTNWKGAYNIIYLDGMGRIGALRDPIGFKPLAYGETEELIAFASESFALEKIGIKRRDIRFVEPGQIISVEEDTLKIKEFTDEAEKREKRICDFELSYFLKPDSMFDGVPVDSVRTNQGVELAKIDDTVKELLEEYGKDRIIVVPIPNTAKYAAKGYADELGLPLVEALTSTSYGRTFIQKKEKRELSAGEKYNLRSDKMEDKIVIYFDDSYVKGNTTNLISTITLERANPYKLLFRFAHPAVKFPCYDGIDIPDCSQLPASGFEDQDKLEKHILEYTKQKAKTKNISRSQINKIQSIKYLDVAGHVEAITTSLPDGRDIYSALNRENLCLGCTTGDYPTDCAKQRFKEENKDYLNRKILKSNIKTFISMS